VSSNSPVQAPPKAAPAESTEATNGGKDVKNDGDTDDATATATATATAAASAGSANPVINTLGQQIGRNLNVTA
jgi:hypothetical protein